MKKWILVSEQEYALANSKIDLTQQEGEKLLANKELIKKFIMKSKFNYQISLSTGKFKDNEKSIYRSMDTCDELCRDVDSIETAFVKYNLEQEEKARKEKEEKEAI